ncbi:MAG: hypothetical protein VYE55_00810 [Verrucomicrobiota bacterium]|nr:hypothetical protein [Verrucomicrobiota bacterium]
MVKRLLILLVTAPIIFGAYEYYKIRANGYPTKTYLLNNKYRLKPVNIQGVTSTHLQLNHRNNDQLYFVPIDDLHLVSRLQVKLYPLNSYIIEDHTGHGLPIEHVRLTLAKHGQIISQLEELREQRELSQSDIKKRSIMREMNRMLIQLKGLEKTLDRHEVDYQRYSNKKNRTILKRLVNLVEKIANRAEIQTN